jgi:hypothetical protein
MYSIYVGKRATRPLARLPRHLPTTLPGPRRHIQPVPLPQYQRGRRLAFCRHFVGEGTLYRLTSSRSHPTLAKDCERVKRIQTERGTTEIFYATRGVHWCNKKNHDKIRGVNHSQLTLPFKNVHT